MKNITFQIARRARHVMSHEVHTEIELYYLTRGERLYFVENRTYRLSTGSVIFINSNRIHKTSALGDPAHERMLLEICPSFLSECQEQFPSVNFGHLFSRDTVIITPENPFSRPIRNLFEEIKLLAEACPMGYEEEVHCDVFKLFLNFQRALSLDKEEPVVYSQKRQKVYDVVEYISQNMSSISSLDEVCAHFFISKYYLSHVFKEVTGMTIMAFLNTTRIQRARVLLCENSLSISEIARTVGYENVGRFTDVFKRTEGVTPREFRRRPDLHPWQREELPADASEIQWRVSL